MSDLISRADAMGAVQDHFNDDGFKGYDDGQKMMDRIKALPSAVAVHKPDYSYEADMVKRLRQADAVSREDGIPCPICNGIGVIKRSLDVNANMVDVVRCKDCRYYKKIAERSDSGLCHRDIVASAWKENGYCSRGERKGGADMRGDDDD